MIFVHGFFIIINMEKYQEQYVKLLTKTCFTELWGPVSDNPHLHPGKARVVHYTRPWPTCIWLAQVFTPITRELIIIITKYFAQGHIGTHCNPASTLLVISQPQLPKCRGLAFWCLIYSPAMTEVKRLGSH